MVLGTNAQHQSFIPHFVYHQPGCVRMDMISDKATPLAATVPVELRTGRSEKALSKSDLGDIPLCPPGSTPYHPGLFLYSVTKVGPLRCWRPPFQNKNLGEGSYWGFPQPALVSDCHWYSWSLSSTTQSRFMSALDSASQPATGACQIL